MRTLEGRSAESRLKLLERRIRADRATGFVPVGTGEVNNHIHTRYSFSPYTPTEAAYAAWRAGLGAAGIIDHESVSGCSEMLRAGKRLGLAITAGCELRARAHGTAMEGRRINNPDSLGILYMVLHGIPHQHLGKVDNYLKPIRKSRYRRMKEQVGTLNGILIEASLPALDFDSEVVALSMSDEGGSITERHILFALAKKMSRVFGRGEKLRATLKSSLGLSIPDAIVQRISDQDNPHFLYDLLGLFKSFLVPLFFHQPDENECPPVREVSALARSIGAIPCYPYLGDVGESSTGDKKTEAFEDSWLDELFDELPKLGFQALSYMPPRNTLKQLARVKAKCVEKGLMEISGVDINSSRQSFRCPELSLREFSHLNDCGWALIAHEHLASAGGSGLFDPSSFLRDEPLNYRLDVYARMGRSMDPTHPESIIDAARKEGIWTE